MLLPLSVSLFSKMPQCLGFIYYIKLMRPNMEVERVQDKHNKIFKKKTKLSIQQNPWLTPM